MMLLIQEIVANSSSTLLHNRDEFESFVDMFNQLRRQASQWEVELNSFSTELSASTEKLWSDLNKELEVVQVNIHGINQVC